MGTNLGSKFRDAWSKLTRKDRELAPGEVRISEAKRSPVLLIVGVAVFFVVCWVGADYQQRNSILPPAPKPPAQYAAFTYQDRDTPDGQIALVLCAGRSTSAW